MATISTILNATEFKARCLQIMDDVNRKKQEVVITKHGRSVAKLIPVVNDEEIFGCMEGTGTSTGDIFGTNEHWDAEE